MNIKRRDFVKLATAAMTLPWLSNVARAQQNNVGAKRVLIVTDPYGRFGDQTSSSVSSAPWIESNSSDYELQEQDLGWILSPLQSHLENLSVLSGVFMRSRQVLGGGASHAQVNSYALTGNRVTGNIRSTATVSANPSINTFIGDELNAVADTKGVFNSLGLGNVGQSNYASDGRRASNLGNPSQIYQTAFGSGSNADTSGLLSQQIVVEQVRNQLALIAPELIQANASNVIDAYRTSIDQIASELEVRASGFCEDRTPNNVLGSAEGEAGITQMFDGIYDLFACGLTPSLLYGWTNGNRHAWLRDENMFGNVVNNYLTNRNYHNLSHRRDDDAGAAQGLVMRAQASEISRLADRLSTTPELDGSGSMMMDNTIIFYTQYMCSPTHVTTQPYYNFILAGENTNVQRGMHLDCSGHTDNEMFTTLAQAAGIPITRFGGFRGNNYDGEELNRGPISKVLLKTLEA